MIPADRDHSPTAIGQGQKSKDSPPVAVVWNHDVGIIFSHQGQQGV